MRKLGAVDIGSNSIRLLIAGIEGGRIVESFKTLEMVRIGKYEGPVRRLSEEAIERSMDVLRKFMETARKEGIAKLSMIATSAVRESENGNELVERVDRELGQHVEVVTGKREAELGFLGVLAGLEQKDENILVADVGGGSTELILGNSQDIQYIVSLNVGCVQLTDIFGTRDRIEASKLKEMAKKVDHTLYDAIGDLKKFQIDRVIGIGGTITTLASVVQKLETYDPKRIHQFRLTHRQIQDCLSQFSEKNLEERKQMVGMYPKRADVITAGTVIFDRLLALLGKDEMAVSEYDNLEGLIFEQLQA
ncbi:MAG TPA: Ppx/GppA family phosphatase [Clostridiales bacterium]|nr:Ppx/GppA family phosphatase [Clostridiales bacterium]